MQKKINGIKPQGKPWTLFPKASLDRTSILIEQAFRKENHQKEKLIFENLWLKNG